MPDPNYTALLVLLDRSGSMSLIANAMVGAVSKLLNEQAKAPGLITADLVIFDHEIERTHHLADPANITLELIPRGGTALYDVVGSSIWEFSTYISSLPDHARPSTVQVVIVTDGVDTASVEYTPETVRSIVSKHEDAGWQFTFLGVSLDVDGAARDLGTRRGTAVAFERTSASVGFALAETSRHLFRQRMTTGRS